MSRPARPSAALWALLAGNFVIGSGVMVVAGTLNQLSDSLQVSVATAGQLITAGALVMCVGAPLMASLVARWDRRVLLTASLLWYAAGHALAAAMPDYASVLVVRMLTVVAPAIFTPQAAACVSLLVPPEQRGRAVTFVFLGWSLASVLGMPMGAVIGGQFGWRVAFGVIALASLLCAAWVWRALPPHVRPEALSRAAWGRVLGNPLLMGVVLVTLLQSSGQFVLSSYLAPLLRDQLHATPLQLGLFWALFGLCGLAGNMLASRHIDRLGAGRMVTLSSSLVALGLLLWPLGLAHSWLAVCLVMVPWGLGCFATNSAQQARLVGMAPALAAGSVALNSSAMYTGQAIGAGSGGWLLAHGASGWMAPAGVMAMLLAIALGLGIERRQRQQAPRRAG
ncbi:MFS transporter [Xenophilus arseniciresistens]|uniref:MFS transporter n=1 Tax=Xenophilus arseniciresistens TaxID=1283306 RepID=A0AAE3N415_9BURK|nr:MFS transporter [Xenophilus arseniciresistens]MDA7415120.1 MFS transporter [Xenophilus arseniciresistens]